MSATNTQPRTERRTASEDNLERKQDGFFARPAGVRRAEFEAAGRTLILGGKGATSDVIDKETGVTLSPERFHSIKVSGQTIIGKIGARKVPFQVEPDPLWELEHGRCNAIIPPEIDDRVEAIKAEYVENDAMTTTDLEERLEDAMT